MKMNDRMFFYKFCINCFHSVMQPLIHSPITNYLSLTYIAYANSVTSPAPTLKISGAPLLKSTTLEV